MKTLIQCLLMLVLSLPAWAQEEAPGAGTLLLEDEQGTVLPALIRDVEVTLDIQGLVAHVTLRQQFSNASTGWVQGLYQMPLPENARTDSVVLEYGNTRLQGEIHEREAARAIHEQASREGRRSALVAWSQPGLFDVRAANIPPGETVTVEISWVQPVPWINGGFELRLPMTYTPRYRPANLPENPVDAPLVTDHLPEGVAEDDLAMPQFTLRGRLQAGLPLKRVASLYHDISVDALSEQDYELQLSQGLAAANRDFVLRWEPERQNQPLAGLYHQQHNGEDYWALMLVPQREEQLPQVAREMVFVVDVSGSMTGTSIEQARAALLQVLDSLRPDDRLNIIAFSSDFFPLWQESRPADTQHLREARAFVQSLEADGGTEMLPALRFALLTPQNNGLLRQVVFLTDGAVSQPEALYQLVKARAGKSRIFPVGIGAAPNSAFMRQMARLGRGVETHIGDLGEVGFRIQQLFEQLRTPALRDIEVAWPELAKGQLRSVPDLYLGQPLWQLVKTEGPVPDMLKIDGLLGSKRWLRAVPTADAVESPWLYKLWAGQFIQDRRMAMLLGEIPPEDRDSTIRELTDLALDAGLVSPWTSFVVTAEERARPEEEEQLDMQAANASPAAPVARKAATLALPQTDLPLDGYLWLLLAGLLTLLAARAGKPA